MPDGLRLRYGFIGLGNMGSSLAAGLLDSGAVSPGFTVVANRSLAKAQSFARRYPGVTVAESNLIAAEGSDTLSWPCEPISC